MWDKLAGNSAINAISTTTNTAAGAVTCTMTPTTVSPGTLGPPQRVVIHGIQWALSTTAPATTTSIMIGDGTKVVGPFYITAGGPGVINFMKPMTVGKVVTATLSAPGSGNAMLAIDYEMVI